MLAEATFTAVVRTDRAALMHRIRDDVNRQAAALGIEVVDVRLRRADLPEPNSQAVFQRMQTERQREAADIRAQGSQLSQTIQARADRDVTVLRAEATRKRRRAARRRRGRAQPRPRRGVRHGSRVLLLLPLDAGLRGGAARPVTPGMVLSPDCEFFRYFNDPTTRPRPAAARDASAGCRRPLRQRSGRRLLQLRPSLAAGGLVDFVAARTGLRD